MREEERRGKETPLTAIRSAPDTGASLARGEVKVPTPPTTGSTYTSRPGHRSSDCVSCCSLPAIRHVRRRALDPPHH
eukprot:9323950-Pyramimonas_sp.AAC.1